MPNNYDSIGELELKDCGMWDLEWESWKEDKKITIEDMVYGDDEE